MSGSTPNSNPVPSGGAVFVSYAREDTAAARRICDALRAAGVEVWFDQEGGLEHGDEWDQKIRRQIRECMLFIPMISANTQARREGYFRIEWDLAAERAQGIAHGVPFILPVVIDETREQDALVPDRFRKVQWTRLPGGETSPGFVVRVAGLLSGQVGARAASPARPLDAGGPPALPARRLPTWAWGALAIAVAVGIWTLLSRTAPATTAANPKPQTPNSEPMDLASAKSIAVLPFANRSPDKENEFFTDGVHEDVLTNLFNIRELRVVSRTSVEQYRSTTKSMKQIGAELGVAYILEGSVQRVGGKVRVTGQLIDARSDRHLWAKSYDRDLSDIFVIQAELARAIAGELQAVLSPQERTLIERRPTENPAAYDLYLKARELTRGTNAGGAMSRTEALLQAAVELDPKFAVAWAQLCYVHGYRYFFNQDHTATQRSRAKAAMDTAVRLAPESPEAVRAVGDYYYYGLRDYPRAVEQYEGLARLQPNYPEVHRRLAAVLRRQGRWVETLATFRKVTQLDPGDLFGAQVFIIMLESGRRYDEADVVWRRLVSTQPDDLRTRFGFASISYRASGSSRAPEEFLARLTSPEANSDDGINSRRRWAMISGNLSEFVRLDQAKPNLTPLGVFGSFFSTNAIDTAIVLAAQGNSAGVQDRFGDVAELRHQVESDPTNEVLWAKLGMTEALLGHKEEALRCARKAVELVPESFDTFDGPRLGAVLAFVYAWTGDKDRAIAEYARLLSVPFSGLNIYEMKRDPTYFPLRGDPRFEALLADPKNNAPLF